jgi:thiamine biosynthesis lipoprotein
MKRSLNRRAFMQFLGILGGGWTAKGWTAPLQTMPFSSSLHQTSETRNLMGTFVTLTLLHPSRDQAQAALSEAFQRQEALIRLFDRHDPASALSALNERGALSDPPPDLLNLLGRSLALQARTGGRFDVTIKPLLDLYESEKEKGRLPAARAIKEALGRVGAAGLKLSPGKIAFSKEGMGITLDGIAKGTVVDETIAFLRKKGIRHALVDAGGDLRVMGGRADGSPWRIGVYDPDGDARSQELILLREGAVATSGNYMVYFDREKVHHHILSPESGASPLWSTGTTVIAPSAEKADALATALMLFSPAEGRSFIDRQGRPASRVLTREGEKVYSVGWPRKHRTQGGKTSHG